MGWTELFTADFDGDGQRDYLIGYHFPGVGSCVTARSVLVLILDAGGRLEFETTTCSREKGEGKGRVYVAGRDTLPGYGQGAEEMLAELTAVPVAAVIWEGRAERRIDTEHGRALLVEAMAKGFRRGG